MSSPAERFVDEVPDEGPLRLFASDRSLVDVRPVRRVALDEPFGGHHLQRFERRGVANVRPLRIQFTIDFMMGSIRSASYLSTVIIVLC